MDEVLILVFLVILNIWAFPEMGVALNHPFLMGFSIINHPSLGTPIFGNPHITTNIYHNIYNTLSGETHSHDVTGNNSCDSQQQYTIPKMTIKWVVKKKQHSQIGGLPLSESH